MTKKNGSSGQALVEFALILVVLLLFIFIIVEAGRLFQGWLTVQNAARAGGRYAITGLYDPECLSDVPACIDPRVESIKEVSEDASSGLNIDENASFGEPLYHRVEVWGIDVTVDDNGVVTETLRAEFAGDSGKLVFVRVTYRMPIITPILNSIVPSVPLVGRVTLNNENWDQTNVNQSNNNAPDPPDLPPGEPSADVFVTKSDSPDPVLINQPLKYTILAANEGPFPAPNVVVTDTLPAGVTLVSMPGICTEQPSAGSGIIVCQVGYLDMGQTASLVINTTAPNVGGTITNTAVIASAEYDEQPDSNFWSEHTTVVDSADQVDLQVVNKIDSKDPLVYNESFIYTITIRNNGPGPATNVIVNDELPSQVSFVAVTSTMGNCLHDAGLVLCTIPAMANGDTATIEITVVGPDTIGTFVNTATIDGDENDPVPSNNSFQQDTSVLEPLVNLAINKSDSPDPVSVNQNLVYGIFVTNDGPATANNVTVVDTLPAGVNVISAIPSQGSCNQTGNPITCNLGTIADQGTANVAITVQPTTAGTLSNSATVDADETDPDLGDNTDSEITTVQGSADLSITKSGPATGTTGVNMTYSLVASNSGPSPATNVVVIDTLPSNVSFVSATASQGGCTHSGSSGGGIVTCNMGNVLSGASATVTIVVVPFSPFNPTTNTASVSSSLYDPVPTNNTASWNTNVSQGSVPFITVSPVCGEVNTTITVHGYNWPTSPNNKDLVFTWDPTGPDPTQVLLTVPNFNQANWTRTVTVPSDAALAYHTILVQRFGVSASIQYKVPCPKPDLVISKATLVSTPPIAATTPVSFRFTVTNTGDAPANSTFFVGVYFDPTPAPNIGVDTTINSNFLMQMVGLNGLAVGASRTVTLTIPGGFSTPGTHTVYGMVDNFGDPPYRVINELSEVNNIGQPLQVTVVNAPTPTPTLTPSPGPSPTASPTPTIGPTIAPGSLIGQAFVTTIGGQTLPQSGVFIYLYDDLGNLVNPLPVQSDQNAFYSFTGLTAGDYTVTGCITLDGQEYFYSSAVTINGGGVTTRDLFLTIGPCVSP